MLNIESVKSSFIDGTKVQAAACDMLRESAVSCVIANTAKYFDGYIPSTIEQYIMNNIEEFVSATTLIIYNGEEETETKLSFGTIPYEQLTELIKFIIANNCHFEDPFNRCGYSGFCWTNNNRQCYMLHN